MAYSVDSFATGAVATGATGVAYFIDVDLSDTWVEVCLTESSEALNIQSETNYETCGEGVSSTFATGIDPEFSLTAILRKDSKVADLFKERYKVGMQFGFRRDTTLIDERLETILTISGVEPMVNTTELLKAVFTGKPSQAVTITSPIPVIP